MVFKQVIFYPDEEPDVHSVGNDRAGFRLDVFLTTCYAHWSRTRIKYYIDAGGVEIRRTGRKIGKIKPGLRLLQGDEVRLTGHFSEPPVPRDFGILHDDPDFIVIDKPAGLPVHPAGRYYHHSLTMLLETDGKVKPLSGLRSSFLVVHRLDRETSGVLLLARNPESCTVLTDQFRSRIMKKRYLAVVHGALPAGSCWKCEQTLGPERNPRLPTKMAVVSTEMGGQEAITEFRTLSSSGISPSDGFSLLDCYPKTGRQHQIRVHLASAGHPIVGDKLYGLNEKDAVRLIRSEIAFDDVFSDNRKRNGKPEGVRPENYEDSVAENGSEPQGLPPEQDAASKRLSPNRRTNIDNSVRNPVYDALRHRLILSRHALHAVSLRFIHPRTNETVQFFAELPSDLALFLKEKGLHLPNEITNSSEPI